MPYLEEAAELHAAIPYNRCPTTDVLDILDGNQAMRLVLEDTVDRGGCTFRQVEKTSVFRYPYHLGRFFKSFLKVEDDAVKVRELFDLLKALDADAQSIKTFWLKWASKRGLDVAIGMASRLCGQLDCSGPDCYEAGSDRPYHDNLLWEVECVSGRRLSLYLFNDDCRETDEELEELKQVPLYEEVVDDHNPFLDPVDEEETWEPAYTYMECLHRPMVQTDKVKPSGEKSAPEPVLWLWAARQSNDVQSLLSTIKYAEYAKLERVWHVLHGKRGKLSATQLEVLWSSFRCREEHLLLPKEREMIHYIRNVKLFVKLMMACKRHMDYEKRGESFSHLPAECRSNYRRLFWGEYKKAKIRIFTKILGNPKWITKVSQYKRVSVKEAENYLKAGISKEKSRIAA